MPVEQNEGFDEKSIGNHEHQAKKNWVFKKKEKKNKNPNNGTGKSR